MKIIRVLLTIFVLLLSHSVNAQVSAEVERSITIDLISNTGEPVAGLYLDVFVMTETAAMTCETNASGRCIVTFNSDPQELARGNIRVTGFGIRQFVFRGESLELIINTADVGGHGNHNHAMQQSGEVTPDATSDYRETREAAWFTEVAATAEVNAAELETPAPPTAEATPGAATATVSAETPPTDAVQQNTATSTPDVTPQPDSDVEEDSTNSSAGWLVVVFGFFVTVGLIGGLWYWTEDSRGNKNG